MQLLLLLHALIRVGVGCWTRILSNIKDLLFRFLLLSVFTLLLLLGLELSLLRTYNLLTLLYFKFALPENHSVAYSIELIGKVANLKWHDLFATKPAIFEFTWGSKTTLGF